MAITKIGTPELFDFSSLNTALKLPTGPTSGTGGRPSNPSTGEWRYNTTLSYVEYYDGAAWFRIDTDAQVGPFTPSGNFNVNTYFGNGATQAIDAKFNEAAAFSGVLNGSFINLGNNAIFSPATQGALTFSCWIKTSSGNAGYIASKVNDSSSPSPTYEWAIEHLSNGTLTLIAYNAQASVVASSINNTATIDDGNWHNVVAVIVNGTSTTLYIDGVPATSTSWTGTAAESSVAVVFLGAVGKSDATPPVQSGAAQHYGGLMDQVRFYNSALDQADVTALQLETTTTASSLSFPSGETAIATYQLDGNGDDISTNYNGTTTDIGYTGLKFTPDFVWIKQRSSPVRNNLLFDTVRGPATNLNILYSDLTNAQDTSVGNGFLSSISTNALNLGSSVYVNGSGEDYVAWCWKAGGTASDITSASSNVSVASRSDNAAAGFSIATYTTNSNSPVVIPHGLDSTPKVALVKNVSSNSDWFWYNTLVSGKGRGFFNQTYAFDNGGVPTLNSTNLTFQAGDPFSSGTSAVVYFFADVTGYQKIGTYTWTNASYTAGTMVTNLGFTPRFVMIKRTNDVGNWQMYDSSRGATSGTQQRYALYADNSDIQNTTDYQSIGFDSDGFSAIVGANGNTTGSGGLNENNGEYLYLAIA
jgi:hypothetical protein